MKKNIDNYKYVDIHCHLNLDAFDEDRLDVIDQMQQESVAGFVVGVDTPSSQSAVALAKEYDNLWSVVGHHPAYSHKSIFESEELKTLLEEDRAFEKENGYAHIVGVGECGFDYHWNEKTDQEVELQVSIFEKQIELALKYDKPLMLHLRPTKDTFDAYDDALALLAIYKEIHGEKLRGDVHFFAGQERHIERFVELGFYVSFTGVITFAKEYEGLILATPTERIMAETDSPYVTPKPFRGRRCLPQYVRYVYEHLEEVKGIKHEEINENVKRLFF